MTVPRVVPDGKTAVDDLSVRELDLISQQMGVDIAEALQGAGGKRWTALAMIAWCWAKRSDPTAKRDPFYDYTADQLLHALGMDDTDLEDLEETPNPTAPASASA